MLRKYLVDIQNVSLRLNNQVILTQVDLTVAPGEIVTLIGPNGAGKSTLVRIVLGLMKPTQGQILREPGLSIGYMPQKIVLDPSFPMSVQRFLALGGGTDVVKRNLSTELGIMGLWERPVQKLSGGELQRVLLARALLREPRLLVLDEPVQGVDIAGQEELYQWIIKLRERLGCGILMVSHDLHLVMAGTDSVVCLNQHVCCVGHPSMVAQHPEFLSLFSVYAHHHNHRH
jgi:zinc transport system ATP-binding protein